MVKGVGSINGANGDHNVKRIHEHYDRGGDKGGRDGKVEDSISELEVKLRKCWTCKEKHVIDRGCNAVPCVCGTTTWKLSTWSTLLSPLGRD